MARTSHGKNAADLAATTPGSGVAVDLARSTMQHSRAFAYVFERPGWPATVGLLTVAIFVPLLGPLLAMGYQSVLVEHLVRHGERNWPAVDLGRITDYLHRGLRLFLVSLVVSVVVTPLAMVVLFGGNLTALLLWDPESPLSIALVGCVVILEAAAFLAVMYAGVAAITPMWVRAALDPDLGGIFDLRFSRDFLARTWKPLLVSHAWMLAASTLLFLAGLLLCFVGMFPAAALIMLLQAYVYAQLYLVYRERGGLPLPGETAPLPAPG